MAWSSAAAVMAAFLGAPESTPPPETPSAADGITPPRVVPGNQAAINNCYAIGARRRGGEGRTVVEVTIAPDGSVSGVEFAPGILPWQEQTARCVIGKMAFEPGERDGAPVAAQVKVPIQFSLQDDMGRTSLITEPRLRSTHEEIEAAFRACYPPDTVSIARPQYSVTIDARGRVTASRLVVSSGDESMDRAGSCMFDRIRFEPATRDNEPIGMTLTMPMLVRPPK